MELEEAQLAIWRLFLERRRSEADLELALASGVRARITSAEVALASIPEVSALDALRANAELTSRLLAQRWIAMKAAREQGESMEQIGSELGVSRQAAWEFLQRKIREGGSEAEVERWEAALSVDGRWESLLEMMEGHPGSAPEPSWASYRPEIAVGSEADGVVIRTVPFGAFIELAPGVAGLMPRSAAPELPSPGAEVRVRIMAIDDDLRRMTLAPV